MTICLGILRPQANTYLPGIGPTGLIETNREEGTDRRQIAERDRL